MSIEWRFFKTNDAEVLETAKQITGAIKERRREFINVNQLSKKACAQ